MALACGSPPCRIFLDSSQAPGPFGCACLISGSESVHRSTTDTWERVSSALPLFFPRSQVYSCFRHLALPKLCQKDLTHGPLPTEGADDGLLKIRTHCCRVDPDLPHLAIEFLLTLFAFEIDLHWTPIILVYRQRRSHWQPRLKKKTFCFLNFLQKRLGPGCPLN